MALGTRAEVLVALGAGTDFLWLWGCGQGSRGSCGSGAALAGRLPVYPTLLSFLAEASPSRGQSRPETADPRLF